MRVLSHWREIRHPGYWRGDWYYHPYSDWIPVYREIDEAELAVKRIENETKKLRALAEQAKARLELMTVEVCVARAHAELSSIAQLSAPDGPKQLAYAPSLPMKVIS